jgi:hypothetical protein
MSKRVAIIGTAPSWIKTPWNDPALTIWALNDAYCSRDIRGQGIPRADAWWELHPLDKMYFRKAEQKVIRAEDVPPGHYIRPEGHIEWLKQQAQTIPVYLQAEPPADWPANARRFNVEAVIAEFGEHWASGPQYMVAQAILDGYEEIHVYGIHLSTQAEYIEQRPLFEHMLGIARGRGIRVVMAEESPVTRHSWRYAYEPKPTAPADPARQALKAELRAAQKRKDELVQALVTWPRFTSKAAALEELRRVQVIEMDALQQLQRSKPVGAVTVAA